MSPWRPKDAAYGLAVLAAGARSWEQIDLRRFALQSGDTGGFWMSYHELTGDYPWLSKRMARVMAASGGQSDTNFPSRHPLAWLLAFVIPRTGMGAGGGLAGMMALVAMLGIVSAIACHRDPELREVPDARQGRAGAQRAAADAGRGHGLHRAELDHAALALRDGSPRRASR